MKLALVLVFSFVALINAAQLPIECNEYSRCPGIADCINGYCKCPGGTVRYNGTCVSIFGWGTTGTTDASCVGIECVEGTCVNGKCIVISTPLTRRVTTECDPCIAVQGPEGSTCKNGKCSTAP